MSLISFLASARYGYPSKQYQQVHKKSIANKQTNQPVSGSIPKGSCCIFFTNHRQEKAPIHCYYFKGLMSVLMCYFTLVVNLSEKWQIHF